MEKSKMKNKIKDERIYEVFVQLKELRKAKRYQEAIELGNKFPNDSFMQSQMIKMYNELEQYERSEEIAKRFPNNPVIQSQLITILDMQGRIFEAKEIVRKFPRASAIATQMVTLLLKEGKIREAEEYQIKFPKNIRIQTRIEEAKARMQEKNIDTSKSEDEECNRENPSVVRRDIQDVFGLMEESRSTIIDIFNMIKEDASNPELRKKIDAIEDKFKQVIILCALAEKTNILRPAEELIKGLKKNTDLTREQLQLINTIEQRLKNKNLKFYDTNFYIKLVKKLDKGIATGEDGDIFPR